MFQFEINIHYNNNNNTTCSARVYADKPTCREPWYIYIYSKYCVRCSIRDDCCRMKTYWKRIRSHFWWISVVLTNYVDSSSSSSLLILLFHCCFFAIGFGFFSIVVVCCLLLLFRSNEIFFCLAAISLTSSSTAVFHIHIGTQPNKYWVT